MATSSSDESSTAPGDFHLSSSLDSGSRLSPNKQRCPLCSSFKTVFYCKECIHSGNFTYSSLYTESYADKQLRLLRYKANKKQIEDGCYPYIENKQKIDTLCSKIRQKKEKIRILKLAIDEKKEYESRNKSKLKKLLKENHELSKSLPKYEERVQKLRNYNDGSLEDIQRSKTVLSNKQLALKNLILIRIKQLIKYIFPINKIQPKIEMESSDSDMITALAEASRTTYVRNHWVYNIDNSGELQHTIVAPSLPGSGNYTAYNDWVTQNKDAIPSSNSSSTITVEQNPAYRISAALTYTAQLVQVLAFYLDIRLPHKLSYSDFCSSDMTEQQFSRRVARLNANVLHLCFSQNTNPTTLQSLHTLHNILQLLDTNVSDLGRQGPMEVNAQTVNDLEQPLSNELQTSEDSDSEESDTVPYEWEAVPRVPQETIGTLSLQSTQTINAQQANSMAGGLVTSAAAALTSIWRGWTGR